MRKGIYVALCFTVIAVLLIAPNLGHRRVSSNDSDAGRLQQMARQIEPEDQPQEAQEFFRLKRSPDGISPISAQRYLRAMRRARQMPQHSTPLDAMLPSEEETRKTGEVSPEFFGSWTQLGPGNIGGRTRALVINPTTPTTMYAGGVAGGVWRTTDGGASWTPLTDLIANIAVNSLAMDPANSNVLYAGTGEGYFNGDAVQGAGIFKTTDGGNTWASLANTVGFHFVNSIVISQNSSSRVYAGTESGVMRSTDAGVTWTNVLNPNLQGGCLQLVMRTDTATDWMVASFGTFTKGALYTNVDAGGAGAWVAELSTADQGLTSLAIAPSNQGFIYAMTAHEITGEMLAVYRSTDGGGSWFPRVDSTSPTKLNRLLLTNPLEDSLVECGRGSGDFILGQGWYDNVLAVDPVNFNRVWAGGIDLFRSDDGGANWGIASYWWKGGPVFAHADQHAIVFQPGYNGTTNQTMFVANDGGIFKTTNAGGTTTTDICGNTVGTISWTNLDNNYGTAQFYYGVSFPDGTSYIGGTQDNGTIRGSDGTGISGWTTALGGDGGAVAVDPTNTNVIYGEFTGVSIQKSTDGGAHFAPATTGINDGNFLFIAPFTMDPSNPQRLWTGGGALWRTTDGAATWTQASTGSFGFGAPAVSAIAVAPSNPNAVLAGMSNGTIKFSIAALSTTSSTTWASTEPRTGYVAGVTIDPVNANIAYAAYATFNQNPGDHHIYKSSDGGATWVGIDGSGVTGLPDVPAHCVTVDPHNSSRLYVGTDLGVFVSIDGGANWARENTGFANVITESLTVNTVGQTSTLFAFTHGRGAWRVTIPTQANYVGFVDHAGCDVIAGWAADRNRLNTSINVEIYDGTTLISTVLASNSRADVGAFLGDNGMHGFSIPTPASLKDGATHSVHIKFETSTTDLSGSPAPISCTGSGPNYTGFIDHAGCDAILGWAADRNRLNTPINVEIYDGTTLVAIVPANLSRGDVGAFLGDNGLHGFRITTPASLQNGAAHSVHIKFEASTTELSGSPASVNCTAFTPNYVGYVDHVGCDSIFGWVADRNRLNTPITVSIYSNGVLIETVQANLSRPDVGAFLGDNGLHGFSVPKPPGITAGLTVLINVRFETSGTDLLSNSPSTLTCP
jgi:hypothetical protein